jgi:hypothetical protein
MVAIFLGNVAGFEVTIRGQRSSGCFNVVYISVWHFQCLSRMEEVFVVLYFENSIGDRMQTSPVSPFSR